MDVGQTVPCKYHISSPPMKLKLSYLTKKNCQPSLADIVPSTCHRTNSIPTRTKRENPIEKRREGEGEVAVVPANCLSRITLLSGAMGVEWSHFYF